MNEAPTERRTPTNLSAEPPYPGAEHVVMLSIRFPDWTGHLAHPDCPREEPHPVAECGVYFPPEQPTQPHVPHRTIRLRDGRTVCIDCHRGSLANPGPKPAVGVSTFGGARIVRLVKIDP
jgi:hypothetical protein